jgi:hypothetical protein
MRTGLWARDGIDDSEMALHPPINPPMNARREVKTVMP